eukprot:1158517-Pelagomonas_calceolata.AAC.7
MPGLQVEASQARAGAGDGMHKPCTADAHICQAFTAAHVQQLQLLMRCDSENGNAKNRQKQEL